MEILEVIKFHNAIFIVTFYCKIILSNAYIWQGTVHFQTGTCEECVQILLHINRIDLGDILNISTKVASLDVEMKKGKMSKTLVHCFNGNRMKLKRKPEFCWSQNFLLWI